MTSASAMKAGLEGVVAAQSEICEIDGLQGTLRYFGYDITELAEHSTFEEVCFLLWNGRLPKTAELEALVRAFQQSYELPEAVWAILKAYPRDATPMEVLRTGISALGHFDPDSGDSSAEARRRKAMRITARAISILGAHHQLRSGRKPIPTRADQSVAANLLTVITGPNPRPEFVRAMDLALILHAEHGLAASTFAARIVASTLSDVFSTVTAAICALKGPLHGGANEDVMKILEQIGFASKADAWVRDALARKVKIPGYGHRVYKTEDPRATILRRWADSLTRLVGERRWFDIAQIVETTMRAGSKVYPNVDFYSGVAYTAMGIPRDLFTPLFAISRISGWVANALEQWSNNRIIRPESEYTGPVLRPYIPLKQRT